MRPQVLFPLFAPTTSLSGVGPRNAALLEKVAGGRVIDLLWHLPVGLIDRRFSPKIADAPDGAMATLVVTVGKHKPPPRNRPRLPYKVTCTDDTGSMDLVFFNVKGDYVAKALPEGEERAVSGKIEHFNDRVQMTHPDHIVPLEDIDKLPRLEPVYGLTAGLTLKTLGRITAEAVALAPPLDEWLDPAGRERMQWPAWRDAVVALHAPADHDDLQPTKPPRMRLAYDELLASQIALLLVREAYRSLPGVATMGDGGLRAKCIAALPYHLTTSQASAVAEITGDMAKESRMLRLLQGDVGSGKTVVAFLAMLAAVEAGRQAVLMAPTEILARQHMATIAPLVEKLGLRLAVLTGRDKGKARQAMLDGLASGEIPIAVGTHALFQDDVAFHDLALAVIDEQHRFGVHERLMLTAKGRGTDVLVMTATPIPRTLQLAAFGDMDVSRLTEKPAGRKPVDTRTIPSARLDDVVAAVGRALDKGAKVYWVCPLVDESELIDLAAATDRHAQLSKRFGAMRVGLVHGRMKGADKDGMMAAFAEGAVDLLVATTVIEVGVDVPAATVMVIEHAERFGLAQLHQLRGRVGRGDKPSTCLLVYYGSPGETARARLSIMRETEDGFRIAEEDLRLRGGGEVLGTRQSGLPDFRLADLSVHGELLAQARDDARLLLERDPKLETPRGRALRVLLYLFERDVAIRYLRSG